MKRVGRTGVIGAARTAVSTTCEDCGAPRPAAATGPCPTCRHLLRAIAGRHVRYCGGCGTVFLVSTSLDVRPEVIDGVARHYCACCHDFLGSRISGPGMALVPGYDPEGQVINARFRHLTPSLRRRHRDPRRQALLDRLVTAEALRTGEVHPPPLFLAT
jgi:hypothetical protein